MNHPSKTSSVAIAFSLLIAPSLAAAQEPAPSGPLGQSGPGATALVHIESAKPATLRAVDRSVLKTASWPVVCISPCDAEVPLAGEYAIESVEGITPSFPLKPGAAQRETITVSGSRSARDWGDLLFVNGFLTSVLGGGLAFAAAACRRSGEPGCGPGWEAGGAVAAGTGVAMLVGGAFLWFKGEMKVKQSASKRTGPLVSSPSSAAAILAPPAGGAPLPPAPAKPIIVPIYTARF
jgi:hypothetical protein